MNVWKSTATTFTMCMHLSGVGVHSSSSSVVAECVCSPLVLLGVAATEKPFFSTDCPAASGDL